MADRGNAQCVRAPRSGSNSGGASVCVPPGNPSLVGPVVGEFREFVDEPASGARWSSASTARSACGSEWHPATTIHPASNAARQSIFPMLPNRFSPGCRLRAESGPGTLGRPMELSTALFGRRTIKDFKADPVPADALERALTAGLWAQNHKLTEPWRFTVLGPNTHRRLADAEAKLLSKPLVVAVSQRLGGDALQQREDYGAISCAVQNIQLAAWAEGLGMQWSSGKIIRMPFLYELLGIDRQAEEIVGLLFFGYPARTPEAPSRRPLSEVTRHLP